MPGRWAGLSAYNSADLAFGFARKIQGINVERLESPLRIFPDDPALGGAEGHVTIAPATPDGSVDAILLGRWAATRKTGRAHPLTDMLKAAIEQPDLKRP